MRSCSSAAGLQAAGPPSATKSLIGYRQRASHIALSGGNLDAAYPKAVDDPNGTTLTATNLTALWRNYSAIGHRRLIYVNTACVLEHKMIVRSMGGGARATYLDSAAESWIARIATDRRAVADVAADVVEATAWTSSPAR